MGGIPRLHRSRGQTETGTGPRKEILVTLARCTSLRRQASSKAFINSSMVSSPEDPLVQATDGNFYGTTDYGGTTNNGSVFRITPAGKLTVIYNFDTTHGPHRIRP